MKRKLWRYAGKTKAYAASYVQIVAENRTNQALSADLRKYLDAILYSLSSNAVWSITCPRYHPKSSYNGFQLSLINEGVQAVLQAKQDSQGNEAISQLRVETRF